MQADLFDAAPWRWIMMSLHPTYYQDVCAGVKKFEYRKGVFLKSAVNAFVYCTVPVKAVGLVVQLGPPICGPVDEIAAIKESEVPGSFAAMKDWLGSARCATAIPIERVHTFPALSLAQLQQLCPGFHPPQRFTYLDTQPEFLKHLMAHATLPDTMSWR